VWDCCDDIEPALSASHALMDDRIDAWAACITLDGHDLADRLWEKAAELDDAMQQERALYTCVAESGKLALWRSAIVPERADPLPWFLDGSLEREAMENRVWADHVVQGALHRQ
jgi:hypothetical protein